MKRLTTDAPKDNSENALNLFYIKDRQTWVRGGGPGPEYEDINLFDFTRLIIKTHIPDIELPADDGNLSMIMPEWLCDGSDSTEGVIALLYTAAWAYAELRVRLKAIEDILGDDYDLDSLRDLVRKNTPVTPEHESLADRSCPRCGCGINWDALNQPLDDAPDFCTACGQCFDWESEEGK